MVEERIQQQLAEVQKADELFSETLLREEQRTQDLLTQKKLDVDRLLRVESSRAQGPRHAASIFGIGYTGYGNSWTEGKPRILYPKERKRPRRHLREVAFSRETLRHAAGLDEQLVPVRIDIDFDKYKLRDTFTWNLHDDTVPVDIFAEQVCEDYGLPLVGFAKDIERSVRAQVADFHPHKYPEIASTSETIQNDPIYTETRDDDLRIPIKLDITIGTSNLVDQIEWDINNSNNNPERYAECFCLELGLGFEFCTAIAHAIREQCQMYTKSLFLAGYSFDSKGVHDPDLRQSILPPVYSSIRPKHQMDQFAPLLSDLGSEQLERIERDREREGRRNRRQTRGKRGAVLPDLTDLPKTFRTRYRNTILLPEEEEIKTNEPQNMQGDNDRMDDSEEEEHEDDFEETENYRHDRSTRAMRASRHIVPPQSNTRQANPPPRSAPLPMQSLPDRPRPKHSFNASELDEVVHSPRHQAGKALRTEYDINPRSDARSSYGHFNGYENDNSPMRQQSLSPPPSRLVVLRLPRDKLAALQRMSHRSHGSLDRSRLVLPRY